MSTKKINNSHEFVKAAINSGNTSQLLEYLDVVSDFGFEAAVPAYVTCGLGLLKLPIDELSPSVFSELAECRIIVFESATPAAFALEKNGEKLILIANSLIDFMAFQALHCFNVSGLSITTGELKKQHDIMESTYYNFLFHKIERNIDDYPINQISSIWSHNIFFALFMASRNLMFFILHELGHISGGHCRSNVAVGGLSPPTFFVDEEFKDAFRQELDADRYAIKVGSSFIGSWGSIFQDYAVLEGLYRYPSGEKHPLAINRLQAAVEFLQTKELDIPLSSQNSWLLNLMDAGRFFKPMSDMEILRSTYPAAKLLLVPTNIKKEHVVLDSSAKLTEHLLKTYADASLAIQKHLILQYSSSKLNRSTSIFTYTSEVIERFLIWIKLRLKINSD